MVISKSENLLTRLPRLKSEWRPHNSRQKSWEHNSQWVQTWQRVQQNLSLSANNSRQWHGWDSRGASWNILKFCIISSSACADFSYIPSMLYFCEKKHKVIRFAINDLDWGLPFHVLLFWTYLRWNNAQATLMNAKSRLSMPKTPYTCFHRVTHKCNLSTM